MGDKTHTEYTEKKILGSLGETIVINCGQPARMEEARSWDTGLQILKIRRVNLFSLRKARNGAGESRRPNAGGAT